MGRLDGKVALISGGARGQGAREAEVFTAEGAKVVFGDVLDQEGRAVEEQIKAAGGDAVYIHLDVTKDNDWQQAVDLAESRYGRLDVLINNAGIARPENVEDTTEELWEIVMSINTTGVFLGTRKAIPAMRRAGGGSIINLSSVAGLVGRRWAGAAYSASKGAVRIFSKATAVQYAPDKIRCNSIHPGPIQTLMLGVTDDDPALMATRTAEIPLGRIGTTDDVANGALFLASDESSWITGIELTIDGGITAQ
jgi:NAD(P)-dependent dehydrogenase (short-subunit alcohol dehydrogenase family)